jgi:hypothetical protein
MAHLTRTLLVALLVAACGGESSETRAQSGSGGSSASNDDYDPCALLTAEEIQAATGWAPDTSAAKTYGTTKTCAIHGTDAMKQSVVIVVARPAPKVSTSAELADRRVKAAAASPEIKMKFTPIEDLGMPAVRSEVEGANPTVEVVVANKVIGVTASDFESSKTLAGKAAARLR